MNFSISYCKSLIVSTFLMLHPKAMITVALYQPICTGDRGRDALRNIAARRRESGRVPPLLPRCRHPRGRPHNTPLSANRMLRQITSVLTRSHSMIAPIRPKATQCPPPRLPICLLTRKPPPATGRTPAHPSRRGRRGGRRRVGRRCPPRHCGPGPLQPTARRRRERARPSPSTRTQEDPKPAARMSCTW